MVSHVERFHKGNVPQKSGCDQCNVKYCYKTSLNRHNRFVHSKNKQISCKICNRVSANSETLKQHIDQVHKNTIRHQCNICSQTFSRNNYVIAHQKSNHASSKQKKIYRPKKNGKFTCGYCFRESQTKAVLERHIKITHEGSQKTPCLKCDKIFVCIGTLNKHMKEMHEKMRFQCDICNKTFCSINSLKIHFKKSHEKTRFRFVCDICNKTFCRTNVLKMHFKTIHVN